MKFHLIAVGLAAALSSLVGAYPQPYGDPQSVASHKIQEIQAKYQAHAIKTLKQRKTGCTLDNVMRRREWGSLPKRERLDYIGAVQCLQRLPSKSPKSVIPGARTRYDDFAGSHIIETPYVHFDGKFWHFHRYIVHLYEKALRDECGYRGHLPYWDWTIDYRDPVKGPLLDGSPYSMGSNGAPISPHPATNISAFGLSLTIPPATGGGCVYSGPFTNYSVHLGPVAFAPRGPDGGLGYNPRCLKRDVSLAWANNTKPTDVLSAITNCTELECFDTQAEAIDGIHAGGHFQLGGLGLDAYASAGDPIFWIHHAQVDRVWTLWQSLDFEARTYQTYGTGTAFDQPPSANVTLDTDITAGTLAGPLKVRRLSSSIDGPFCYMYD